MAYSFFCNKVNFYRAACNADVV